MSELVEPEEAEALAEAAGATDPHAEARVSVVSLRDFSEPRTLSADRIARIRKTLSARLQTIANALAGPLRGHPTMTLADVAETNAHGLFDGFVKPFLVHGFDVRGNQAWIVWDAPAARIACDTILSGPPEAGEDGEIPEQEPGDPNLTRTERRVVASLLDTLLGTIAEDFDLELNPGEVWQEPEELTTLEDLGPDADPRRLLVHLGFEDERGRASDLRLYLPGIVDPAEEEDVRENDNAPSHLAPVDLELSALLGGTNVPLSELLAIEVGDVIPIDRRVGELIEIEVEETVCGRVQFGSKNGRLAVIVRSVERQGAGSGMSERDE